MRRVAPSVIAREQLQELLSGGADRGSNIVSALVETVTRVVVQELLEAEQADFLGGRGRYETPSVNLRSTQRVRGHGGGWPGGLPRRRGRPWSGSARGSPASGCSGHAGRRDGFCRR